MKKIIFVLLSSSFLASCNQVTQTPHVSTTAQLGEVSQTQETFSAETSPTIRPQSNWCNFRYGKSNSIIAAYYDPAMSTYYRGVFDGARANWSGISSNVTVNATSTNSNLPDRYYALDTDTPGLLGRINPFVYNSSGALVGGPEYVNSAWVTVNVFIYINQMQANGMTYSQQVSNATHEIGHSLKMAHPNDASCYYSVPQSGESSVMNQGIQNIGPQNFDKRELKRVWGV